MFNFFFITTAIDAAACLTCIVADVVISNQESDDKIDSKWAYWYICRIVVDVLFTVFLYLHANFDEFVEKKVEGNEEPPHENKDLDLLLQAEEDAVYGASYEINN